MIVIKETAEVIDEAYFWEWLMQCGDFNIQEYVSSPISQDIVLTSMQVLKAFKEDLIREGKLI